MNLENQKQFRQMMRQIQESLVPQGYHPTLAMDAFLSDNYGMNVMWLISTPHTQHHLSH